MRKAASAKSSKPVEWIAMQYEADCWLAACAMAAGSSYEEAEEYFGPREQNTHITLFSIATTPRKGLSATRSAWSLSSSFS